MALDGVIKELLLKAGGAEAYVENNKEIIPVKAAQNFELALSYLNQELCRWPSSVNIETNIFVIQTSLLLSMQSDSDGPVQQLQDLGHDALLGVLGL